MKHVICSIMDSKAFAFISPFVMPTVEMAIRTFAGCANEQGHMFCKHPADFTLHKIGEFDDETGIITSLSPIENLGMAAQHKERE